MTKCSICLNKIKKKYVLAPICKCTVKYHFSCFKQVMKNGLICPICRKDVKEYDTYIWNYNIKCATIGLLLVIVSIILTIFFINQL